MMALIATDRLHAVIGMGQTGWSVARYLAGRGLPFVVMDTRESPPLLAQFQAAFPHTPLVTGGLDADWLQRAEVLVVSPGVALETPLLVEALAAGKTLSSDIELFCEACTVPIIAITGSNGKSTVTSLVGAMAQAAGRRVGIGGNLGTPALDLLADAPELVVLELSSFQLERLQNLRADVACLLNLSPDHLDRYADVPAYHRAKQRIYRHCRHAVFSREDALTQPLLSVGTAASSFGLSQADRGHWGLLERDGRTWLSLGSEPWLAVDAMRLQGRHNWLNALAALAIGHAAGLPREAMLASLQLFAGLPHRCQFVAEWRGVRFINDSKGTNVGATLAALAGLGADARIVLIAGGEPKDQDFSELAPVMAACGRAAVLIGVAAEALSTVLSPVLPVQHAATLDEAVALAFAQTQPGDVVLLSPACASFDMFQGYADRGERFVAAVQGLVAGGGSHAG